MTSLIAQVRAVADRQQWFLTSGESTYVVGVDERNMLESLYWGPALPADATLAKAQSRRERASFDGPVNTTPLSTQRGARACNWNRR